MDTELLLNVGGLLVALEAIKVMGAFAKKKYNGKNGHATANPGMGITKEQMAEMQQSVHDLHEWQVPQMLTELKGIRAAIEENTLTITESHKRLRKSIEEQTGAVVKNTATLEMLEGKIAKTVK